MCMLPEIEYVINMQDNVDDSGNDENNFYDYTCVFCLL